MDDHQGRREFLRRALRGAVTAALGALAAVLVVGRRGSGADATYACGALCGGCPSAARCLLPPARRTRQDAEAKRR